MLAVKLLNWVWFPLTVRYSGTLPRLRETSAIFLSVFAVLGPDGLGEAPISIAVRHGGLILVLDG